MNKIIINVNGIPVRTVPKMKVYCSMSQIFSTYSTPHDALFLVFGVSNAKNLAFDTPDENALSVLFLLDIAVNNTIIYQISTIIYLFINYFY